MNEGTYYHWAWICPDCKRQMSTLAYFNYLTDLGSKTYCLELTCADFLAGANLDNGNPDVLLHSVSRFFKFLPGEQRQAFVEQITEKAS